MKSSVVVMALLVLVVSAHATGWLESTGDGLGDAAGNALGDLVDVTIQVFDETLVDPLQEAFLDPVDELYGKVSRSVVQMMVGFAIVVNRAGTAAPCERCFVGRVKHFRESFDSIRYVVVGDEQERLQLVDKAGIGEFVVIAADPVEESGPDGVPVQTDTFWLGFGPPARITTEDFIASAFKMRENLWVHTVWDLQGDLPGSTTLVYRPIPLDDSEPMRQKAVMLTLEDGYSYELFRSDEQGFAPNMMEYPTNGGSDLRIEPGSEIQTFGIIVSRNE